jgi:hypothetical protein
MPLCQNSRAHEDGGRELTCLEEHLQADDPLFACNTLHIRGTCVPDNKRVSLYPRKSKRKHR